MVCQAGLPRMTSYVGFCVIQKTERPILYSLLSLALRSRNQFFATACHASHLGVADAAVPLEVLLRDAVEGERGNRALEEGSRHAPCAAGAAPAAEVVAVDPDQAFVHASAFACVLDSSLGTAGWKTSMQSSAEGELLLLTAQDLCEAK